jgi:flavin reductase (DIM6/NTAB) family NADH-FMN oxidoreductase RutF
MIEINPENSTSRDFYKLLSGIISPRPIALVSSCDLKGKVNLAPFSFFNMMSIEPPILVFSPLRRMRTNTTKDTLNNVQECPEVVINIIGFEHVEQMSLTGGEYDSSINEFDKSGFTSIASSIVKPPRVSEALASFECKVNSIVKLGEKGGAGNLVICEVVKAYFQASILDEKNQVNTLSFEAIGRLGQSYYTKVNNTSIFEIEKGNGKTGMGWDQMPLELIQSTQLTGNEISKLASISKLPFEDTNYKLTTDLNRVKKVKSFLFQNQIAEAWLCITEKD